MSAALLFAGASAGLELMTGLFGYLASQDAAAISESRGRMIRDQGEADAQRYAEEARNVHAKTKVSYLKAGVYLSGSPLDILDNDILTAQENISAIRAGADIRASDQDAEASQLRMGGRLALLQGVTGGLAKFGQAAYSSSKSSSTSEYDRKDLNSSGSYKSARRTVD